MIAVVSIAVIVVISDSNMNLWLEKEKRRRGRKSGEDEIYRNLDEHLFGTRWASRRKARVVVSMGS